MNHTGAVTVELLKRHGFESAASQLSAPDSTPSPSTTKPNALLSRDAERRPARLGAQLPAPQESAAPGYEQSLAILTQWLPTLPPPLHHQLRTLRFPILVHCYVALASRDELDDAKRLLATHADAVGSAAERRVIQSLNALPTRDALANHALVSRLLGTRVPWAGTSDAFDLLREFLMEKKLFLLLRLVYKFFNMHALTASPNGEPIRPLRVAAADETEGGGTEAGGTEAGGTEAGGTEAGGTEADGTRGAKRKRREKGARGAEAVDAAAGASGDVGAADEAPGNGAAAPSSNGGVTVKAELLKAELVKEELDLPLDLPWLTGGGGESAARESASASATPAAKQPSPAAIICAVDDASSAPTLSPRRRDSLGTGAAAADLPRCAGVVHPSVCLLGVQAEIGELCTAAIAPSGNLIALGRSDGSLQLCRFSRDAMLRSRFRAPAPSYPPLRSRFLRGHAAPVYAATFSSDSQWALSGGGDGGVRLWRPSRPSALAAYRKHGYPVWGVSLASHDAHFLSCCADGGLRLFATERLEPIRLMAAHLSDVTDVAWHPNDAYALSGSHDGTLRLWDVCAARSSRLFRGGHSGAVRAVAISPDGQWGASGGDDGRVIIWDLGTSAPVHSFKGAHDEPVVSVGFSADGTMLTSASEARLCVWRPDRTARAERTAAAAEAVAPLVSCEGSAPFLSAAFLRRPSHTVVAVGLEPAPQYE